jgi:hypothetical protein
MTFRNSEKDDRAVTTSQKLANQTQIAEVYSEMFNLLEEYAPSWYTEDLHCRAAVGLEELKAANFFLSRSGT